MPTILDLENLPDPETLRLADLPGINHDLIREKFAAGPDGLKFLLSIFDFIQKSKHRAETLAQVYFHQSEVLLRRLEAAKAGTLADLDATAVRKARAAGPTAQKLPTAPKKSAVKQIDLSAAIDL